MNILFLASGGGGNFRFLYYAIKELNLNYKLIGLISDRPCMANNAATQFEIYNNIVKYNRHDTEELDAELALIKPDIVITNINKILALKTLKINNNTIFINLHYSLLPAFAGMIGMEPIVAAKKTNNKYIGVSVHQVIEKVDAGEIISQSIFTPNWNGDIKTIYDTVFKIGALTLLNAILKQTNNLVPQEKKIEINNYEITLLDNNFNVDIINTDLFWRKLK